MVWPDKGFYRWMPHVNLLYPFYEDSTAAFDRAPEQAVTALKTIEPFRLRLACFKSFEHSKRSSTVWLDPEPIAGIKSKLRRPKDAVSAGVPQTSSVDGQILQTLQNTLVQTFPECTDLSDDPSRSITGFTPHLSVGGWRGASDSSEAKRQLQDVWLPIEFVVDAVYIISRFGKSDPFTVRWKIPLGTSTQSAQEVNLKYAAVPEFAAEGKEGDAWKKAPLERNAAGQYKKLDMKGLPWGLFAA